MSDKPGYAIDRALEQLRDNFYERFSQEEALAMWLNVPSGSRQHNQKKIAEAETKIGILKIEAVLIMRMATVGTLKEAGITT